MNTMQENNYNKSKYEKVFKLQKDLILLKIKHRTKQKIQTHLIRKIKYEISKTLTSNK